MRPLGPLVGSRFDNGHGMEYAEEARAALLKAVEALAVDAARYRFLRLNYDDSLVMYGDNSHCEMMMAEELDRAIDTTMQKETP